MASDGEIVLAEVQETNWDEKAVIESPFEAKDFIKVLPWKEYGEEVAEYGSLREKSNARDMGIDDAVLDAVEAYIDSEGFPEDFSTHVQWDGSQNAWTIDADAFDEARKFWEFCGFRVSVKNGVDTSLLA